MLSLRNVSKTYREGSIELQALRDVSFFVGKERFTMLVGPSGSGKTTLLNLIGAIDRASSGSVEIDGCELGAMDDRTLTAFRASRIGFIFQNFNLLPVLSAYENVEYALLLAGMGTAERARRTAEVLEAVGLSEHAAHRPSQLSGGQRQRVAIARALVKRPALVLADEPTANLDSETGAGIVQLMRDMQRRYKTTFIFSTHDPELMQQADELLVTRDGRVVAANAPAFRGGAA